MCPIDFSGIRAFQMFTPCLYISINVSDFGMMMMMMMVVVMILTFHAGLV